ncbi:unnamed protein product [Phaedon cochleariae]|uniref:Odorant receptor n=1 Tax=Phaedon cochleariae TaxID=80249 RepID=A0A9P0D7N2_PHACE|nr:unnamed protein product [Phaedon cochleariae]
MSVNQQDSAYPENVFSVSDIIQKLSGIWIPGSDVNIILRILYMAFVAMLYGIGIIFLICEIVIFYKSLADIDKLISNISMLLTHLVGAFKFCIVAFGIKKIRNIMDTLQDKTYHYTALGEFNPGQMMQKQKTINSILSVLFFALYGMCGMSAYMSTTLSLDMGLEHDSFEMANITCYDFMPYVFYIPFPTNKKWECKMAALFMNIGLQLFAGVIACNDGLFVGLLGCLKTQLMIVCHVFTTIRVRTLKKLDLPENHFVMHDSENPVLEEEMYMQLNGVIRHLMILLRVRDEIEFMFTFVTLSQSIASLFIIASCLFVASTVPIGSPNFFSQLEYFVCVVVQFSLICWCGNEITIASESVTTALYESDWFSSTARYKKSMIITMTRMQRPVYLTIGKFAPLSLTVLLGVFRGSFSYFTVFKSIQ